MNKQELETVAHKIVTDAKGPFVNLCFGYSGWTAGQLEREFLDGH